MGPAAKYARITVCDGPEDEQSLLELSPSVRFGRPKKAEELPSPWNAECISRLIGLFILLLIAIGFMLHRFPVHMFHDHSHCGNHGSEEHHHTFSKAAVAAGQLECSEVGADVLLAGGNAVDAAIATMLCQGLVEPYYSGIGGGFGMTIYLSSTKTTTVINAREVAPLASTQQMYNRSSISSIQNPKFIAVPGELKGIDYVYKKYGGGVSWERLFEPVIKKASDGFHVSGAMDKILQDHKDIIIANKALCDVYCDSTKQGVKKEGDTVTNPLLAKTLTLVQKNGVDVFYNGEMPTRMAEEIRDAGGILTAEDFKNYEVEEVNHIEVALPNAGYTIHAPPLPFGGPVFGAILSIMDKFNISVEDYTRDPTLQWHRTVEAFRHAYGARYLMGDPKFVPDEIVKKITSGEFASERVKKIFDDKTFHNPKYYGAVFEEHGLSSTTHMSVLAPNKDCVSVTSTVNYHFGSYFMSPTTGVLFNNEMGDFSYPNGKSSHDSTLSEFNQIKAGKRPLSSMSPVLFFDKSKQPVFIIGAAGGIKIPTSVANVMLRLLYFGTDDFDEPIRAKRLHDSLVPDELQYEDGFDAEILKGLAKIGHNVKPLTSQSHVNGIKNHVSHIHAFSDLRNKGAGVDGW